MMRAVLNSHFFFNFYINFSADAIITARSTYMEELKKKPVESRTLIFFIKFSKKIVKDPRKRKTENIKTEESLEKTQKNSNFFKFLINFPINLCINFSRNPSSIHKAQR